MHKNITKFCSISYLVAMVTLLFLPVLTYADPAVSRTYLTLKIPSSIYKTFGPFEVTLSGKINGKVAENVESSKGTRSGTNYIYKVGRTADWTKTGIEMWVQSQDKYAKDGTRFTWHVTGINITKAMSVTMKAASTTKAKFVNTTANKTLASSTSNVDSLTHPSTGKAPAGAAESTLTDVKFRLFPEADNCPASKTPLTCWISAVFEWSRVGIYLLSTVVTVVAGIVYMTSAGNTKQIELSKKLILGALSAVATIVLGQFFLNVVVGLPWV